MEDIITKITGIVKDPTTGETFTFVGESQEEVDQQIDKFFSQPN